ncbi:MAG: WYL domain-containing protein [Thermoleophilia bacterium]|nr:WYL domain-containing protein [Thermoleophilia bacterium]
MPGAGHEARVTVHASAEQVAARLPWLSGAAEPIDAERCEYRTSDDDLRWLALRIAMFGADVEVDGPPELHAQLDALARRLQQVVRDARAR